MMEVHAHLRHSCVKGYHVFGTGRPRETSVCEREPHNPHSKVAIVVKISNSVVGYVPKHLAAVGVSN